MSISTTMDNDDNGSKQGLIDALRKAARGPSRSKTARLREIFDEVEEAKARGLSHKQIVAALEGRGLKFDLGTFEITRHRILKERRNAGQAGQTQAKLEKQQAAIPAPPRRDTPTEKATPPKKERRHKTTQASAEDLKQLARSDIDLTEYE